jgi:hypothetical protein
VLGRYRACAILGLFFLERLLLDSKDGIQIPLTVFFSPECNNLGYKESIGSCEKVSVD